MSSPISQSNTPPVNPSPVEPYKPLQMSPIVIRKYVPRTPEQREKIIAANKKREEAKKREAAKTEQVAKAAQTATTTTQNTPPPAIPPAKVTQAKITPAKATPVNATSVNATQASLVELKTEYARVEQSYEEKVKRLGEIQQEKKKLEGELLVYRDILQQILEKGHQNQ